MLAYQDMEGYLEYGAPSGNYTVQTPLVQLANGIPVETSMDSLQPDTEYYYRLRTRATGDTAFSASDEFYFHTQRPPGSTFTVTVQADSHLDLNTNVEMYAQTLANAVADKPGFHIDLGDT